MALVQPNDICPCWSNKKYKHCCKGKIDWDAIFRSKRSHLPYMSVRGRNLLFAEAIAEALQLDRLDDAADLGAYKRAFTDRAVAKIYGAIMDIWPPDTDLAELLSRSKTDVAGLYVGDYAPEYLHRAIVRHSLYATKILVVDWFQHPYTTSDRYSPILNPSQYRAQALRNVNLFFSLLPWIDAGLVEVVRTPGDFDRQLQWDFMKRAQAKAKLPEYAEAIQTSLEEIRGRSIDDIKRQDLLLSAPDSYLKRMLRESGILNDEKDQEKFIKYVQQQRDADPNFLEPLGADTNGQLRMMTTGGPLEAARITAQMASAYLFTDLDVRWKLIEADRRDHSVDSQFWSPFAKAVQNAKLSYLNGVRLEDALRLRKENRLEGIRKVMRDAWTKEQSDDEYDDVNALSFAENFAGAVDEATAEWERIKGELARQGGVSAAGVLTAAGPLIASGNGVWLAGATAVLGATTGLYGRWQHASFLRRFPAGFFMKLREEQ